MSSDLAIECKEITKTFGQGKTLARALQGVNLQVKRGDLFMLMGPSGCGKTTLISIIAGVLGADSGSCKVFGRTLGELSDRELTKFRSKTVGFVFQAYNLIPTINTRENVAVPLIIHGIKRREAFERADETLAKVGLSDKRWNRPSDLSGGQQQRVAIARALVHDPKLIVCDEPTSALDHRTGQMVMELFREVASQDGRTLIIVTHDSRIVEFADEIAEMDDGVIVSVRVSRGGSHKRD